MTPPHEPDIVRQLAGAYERLTGQISKVIVG